MAKSKKTKAERRNECLAADQQAWKSFEPKLAALQTREDALALVAAAPPESAPGRRYYSNLDPLVKTLTGVG